MPAMAPLFKSATRERGNENGPCSAGSKSGSGSGSAASAAAAPLPAKSAPAAQSRSCTGRRRAARFTDVWCKCTRSGKITSQNDCKQKTAKCAWTGELCLSAASWKKPIVTEITKATTFYVAQISHQDYYRINGSKDGYCRMVIAPKLEKLKLDKK